MGNAVIHRKKHHSLSSTKSNDNNTVSKTESLQDTIVWLDACKNPNEISQVLVGLRKICNEVVRLTKADEFNEFLQKSTSGRVILIISGAIGRDYIPKIHTNPKIDSIYIFCRKVENYQSMLDKFERVHGVYALPKDLFRALEVRTSNIGTPPIEIIENGTVIEDFKIINSETDIDVCIISHALLDEFKSDEWPRPDLQTVLQEIAQEQKLSFDNIKVFDKLAKSYASDHSTLWYVILDPLRRIIDSAFQNEDILQLFRMRTILNDMQCSIEENRSKEIHAYKVQLLPTKLLREIKEKSKVHITFSSFLTASTTQNNFFNVAKPHQDSSVTHIQIEAEQYEQTTSFGFIPKFNCNTSETTGSEDDVIFLPKSVFHVISVQETAPNVWLLQLKFVPEFYKERLETLTPTLHLCGHNTIARNLMVFTGAYEKLKDYYKAILNTLTENDQNAQTIRESLAKLRKILANVNLKNVHVLSFLVPPQRVLYIIYKLENSLTPFSQRVLDMLKTNTKDELSFVKDQLESIDASSFKDKSVLFFTSMKHTKAIETMFPGTRILSFDEEPETSDNTDRFTSIDQLICHLCDLMVKYCQQWSTYFSISNNNKVSDLYKQKMQIIHQNFYVIAQQMSGGILRFDQCKTIDPMLFWLNSPEDKSHDYKYAEDFLKGKFHRMKDFSDPNNCCSTIIRYHHYFIFVVISHSYENETRDIIKDFANVIGVFQYHNEDNSNRGRKRLRRTLIFQIISDLIRHYRKASQYHQLQQNNQEHCNTLLKEKEACLFMANSVI